MRAGRNELKLEMECCARVGVALDPEFALVAEDNRSGDGQSDSQSLRFRRKKWIEKITERHHLLIRAVGIIWLSLPRIFLSRLFQACFSHTMMIQLPHKNRNCQNPRRIANIPDLLLSDM